MIEFLFKSVVVFLAMTAVDACWTFYTAKVSEKKAVPAALWSVGIMLCGAIVTVSYIEDRRLLAAAALGCFVGTYLAVGKSK